MTVPFNRSSIVRLAFLTFAFVGCTNVQTRHEVEIDESEASKNVSVPQALAPEPQIEQTNLLAAQLPPAVEPAKPPVTLDENGQPKKIVGVILGPGGIRSYAHVGVLQEFIKAKIPVQSIVGLEFSSIVAAAFAAKMQTYDVEWQMMKLHEDEFFKHGFLSSGGPQDPQALQRFLESIFGKSKIESSKAGFACPVLQISDRNTVVKSQGLFTDVLPSCFPYSPFFKPNNDEMAGVTALTAAVQFLRSRGVNYVVYVDLLSDKRNPLFNSSDSESNGVWSSIADSLETQNHDINKTVAVPLGSFSLNDFAHRREILQKGQETGHNSVVEIQNELGL